MQNRGEVSNLYTAGIDDARLECTPWTLNSDGTLSYLVDESQDNIKQSYTLREVYEVYNYLKKEHMNNEIIKKLEEERDEINLRVQKLKSYINDPESEFKSNSAEQQRLLRQQLVNMMDYVSTLHYRIQDLIKQDL